jgi:hypothetical protein
MIGEGSRARVTSGSTLSSASKLTAKRKRHAMAVALKVETDFRSGIMRMLLSK